MFNNVNERLSLRSKAEHYVMLMNANEYLRGGKPNSLCPIFRCGYCRSKVKKNTSKYTGKKRTRHIETFSCSNSIKIPREMRHLNYNFSAEKCTAAIWHQVDIMLHPDYLKTALREISRQQSKLDTRAERLQTRLFEIDTALERTIKLVRDGYPEDLIQKPNFPLLEERKTIQLELNELQNNNVIPQIELLRGINRKSFIKTMQAASFEDQLDFLWSLFTHIILWKAHMEFHFTWGGNPVDRSLPPRWFHDGSTKFDW